MVEEFRPLVAVGRPCKQYARTATGIGKPFWTVRRYYGGQQWDDSNPVDTIVAAEKLYEEYSAELRGVREEEEKSINEYWNNELKKTREMAKGHYVPPAYEVEERHQIDWADESSWPKIEDFTERQPISILISKLDQRIKRSGSTPEIDKYRAALIAKRASIPKQDVWKKKNHATIPGGVLRRNIPLEAMNDQQRRTKRSNLRALIKARPALAEKYTPILARLDELIGVPIGTRCTVAPQQRSRPIEEMTKTQLQRCVYSGKGGPERVAAARARLDAVYATQKQEQEKMKEEAMKAKQVEKSRKKKEQEDARAAKRAAAARAKHEEKLLKKKKRVEVQEAKLAAKAAKAAGRTRCKPFAEMTKSSIYQVIYKCRAALRTNPKDEQVRARLAEAEAYYAALPDGRSLRHSKPVLESSLAKGAKSPKKPSVSSVSVPTGKRGSNHRIVPLLPRYFGDIPDVPSNVELMSKINEIIDWINKK